MTLLLLAPDLERTHQRLLGAMLMRAGLDGVRCETWAEVREHAQDADDGVVVASFGRAALDLWHDYRLILVGNQHGCMFRHRDTDHLSYDIMVLEHPGTLMQLSMTGYTAKAAMRDDLLLLREVLEGRADPEHWRMSGCGKCQTRRVKGGGVKVMPAVEWVAGLDMVGLCDMHYMKRGQIKSKKVKKRVDPSSHAAQIDGQGSLFSVPKS